MISFVAILSLASSVAVARELNQFNLIIGNATNGGLVEATTTNTSDGSNTLGFTNKIFDSLFDGNLTAGLGRVRSFRVTVSNTTGTSEQESTGGSNTSAFITTNADFVTESLQRVTAASENTGQAGSTFQNARTGTVTSGETIGLSKEFNATGRVGSFATNQLYTVSARLGQGQSVSEGTGFSFSRTTDRPNNKVLASQSQGISSQTVQGTNIFSSVSSDTFSASGSEETASNCFMSGSFTGEQVVDGPNTQSQSACTSAGYFIDRNL